MSTMQTSSDSALRTIRVARTPAPGSGQISAHRIVRRAYERGVLRPGVSLFQATSGNTGISICAIGRAMGHPVTIFMPDWMSRERIDLIRSLGATIRLVTREASGFLGLEPVEGRSESKWRRVR